MKRNKYRFDLTPREHFLAMQGFSEFRNIQIKELGGSILEIDQLLVKLTKMKVDLDKGRYRFVLTDRQRNFLVNGLNKYLKSLRADDQPTGEMESLLIKLDETPPLNAQRRKTCAAQTR